MPGGSSILVVLAAVSVKALLLVAMGSCAASALRRGSASCRHLLWTAVLAGVLIIALTGPAPPSWSIPYGATLAIPGLDHGPVVADPDSSSHRAAPPASRAEPGITDDTVGRTRTRAVIEEAIVWFWIAGVLILALRLAVGQIALRRIAASGRAIESGSASVLLRMMAAGSRALRRVRLIETDALPVPATWGVFRAVIALPSAAAAWPASALEAAMRHEIAHVERRDVLTQLGADLCCAVFWFHPAVWFAARRMRAERERACDDAVLSSGGVDVDYAELLLDVAASVSGGGSGVVPTALAMADTQGLAVRLRAILDPTITRRSPRKLMASVPACVLFVTVAIAGLDVSGAARSHAVVPDGAEIMYGEALAFTLEQERRALDRQFQPRNERESQAIERIQEAARHEKQHPMDLIRERAIWALSIAREDEVVGPLVAQLESADWRVRAYAAWNLDLVGAQEARVALTRRLRDPIWRVRSLAAGAVAGLADPRSKDDVLPLLTDPAWQVRVPAVEFLSRIGTPEALAAVRERLNDPHIAVRSAASAALGESRTQ